MLIQLETTPTRSSSMLRKQGYYTVEICDGHIQWLMTEDYDFSFGKIDRSQASIARQIYT